MTTVAQIASEAIEVLEARGWCQGENAHPDGRVCLQGAINIAAYGSPNPFSDWFDVENDGSWNFVNPATEAVWGAAERLELVGFYAFLHSWNDASSRSPGEVEDLLRSVAEDPEAEATEVDLSVPGRAHEQREGYVK